MSTPDLREATGVWLRIGCLSFGGPAAQIALMHRMIVEERDWLSERQFLGALSFCMLLPGPEAMQLATYAGWRLHGLRGGLIAGLSFVLPGAVVIAALAWAYAAFGSVPFVEAMFTGIKAAVLIIVVEALLRVSRKALLHRAHWVIAGLTFLAIFVFSAPFPAIIAVAALFGYLTTTRGPSTAPPGVPFRRTLGTIIVWLAIWAAPFVLLLAMDGPDLLLRIGAFFSQLAVVTFGGAYAVLAYMAQDVVVAKEWLTAGQMMDGLGLAETTPGPLILVTEFVGFLTGYVQGGPGLALAAALVTLWVTFVPCFLWIFAGAPYVDWLTEHPRLRGGLEAITAAVVGVIANLSLWFGLHVLFRSVHQVPFGFGKMTIPDLASPALPSLAIAGLCGWLLLVRQTPLIAVLGVAVAAGVALDMVTQGP